VRRFEMSLPRTVDECLKVLADDAGGTKLIAGGTDLVRQMKNGVTRPARVVDLSGVAALRVVESANGAGLRLGAAVTARTVELDPRIRTRYPSLAESGALVGRVRRSRPATDSAYGCVGRARPSAP